MTGTVPITLTVNGVEHEVVVAPRALLGDVLREQLDLTGTNVACRTGQCGACTVQLDGAPMRSCLLFALQADGHAIRTVEGLAGADGTLHPLQEAFGAEHALQCGFCTPGFLMTLEPLVDDDGPLDEAAVRTAASANLCRCTGYDGIVRAVLRARAARGQEPPA